MDRLEQLCRDRGLRFTEHRRIVLEVMEGATDHPSVREIYRRAAAGHRIGLATVYRTLNSFVRAGLVRRHAFADGNFRYERAGRAAHAHLIDVKTGAIVEIDDQGLSAVLEGHARRAGYRLVDFRLELFVHQK